MPDHATVFEPAPTAKHKPDETPFYPRITSHVYPSKNYWREQILIETPGSFSGKKGSYKAFIDEDTKEFVFKIPPNDLFNNPHSIHAYQATKWGRQFGDDSAKEQAFKESTKSNRKNWSTFRHELKFNAEKSFDLDVPWIDYAKISDVDGIVTPVMIVELKSSEPIEKEEEENDIELTAHSFVSPSKAPGVNFSGGTAQEALFLQEMIRRGFKLSDIENFSKANNDKRNLGTDENAMTDETVEEGRNAKNPKTTVVGSGY